jgi:hypothetical protein
MKYVIAICLTFAAISSALAAEMSHEETAVRTAYAKFAYASEQNVMAQLAMESMSPETRTDTGMSNDQRLAAAQVSFTLSDFVVGNVQDIINRKAVDFITPANGETLVASPISSQFAEGGTIAEVRSLSLHWQSASPLPPELADTKLADLYQFQWHRLRPEALWQRYAAYTVTTSFKGKTHGPYRALFIFGHDALENETIEPEDGTTDAMGLAYVMQSHLFPTPFVRTRVRGYQVIAAWLNTKQMSGPSCSVGLGDVCCDPADLRCGPSRQDVADGLSRPLPVPGKP